MGAVIAAQVGLKMVTMAVMKPPKTPSISRPDTVEGSWVSMNSRHVYAAVAKAQMSRMPVRLTVPFRVIRFAASMAPPKRAASWNVLEPKAGLEVLNRGIKCSLHYKGWISHYLDG